MGSRFNSPATCLFFAGQQAQLDSAVPCPAVTPTLTLACSPLLPLAAPPCCCCPLPAACLPACLQEERRRKAEKKKQRAAAASAADDDEGGSRYLDINTGSESDLEDDDF